MIALGVVSLEIEMSKVRRGIAIASVVVCLCAAARAQAPPPASATEAPVVVGDRTLFTIRTSIGPFTAQERAEAAAARLSNVAHDLTARIESISAVRSDLRTDITLGNRVLTTVTDEDAAAVGQSRDALVTAEIASIRSEIIALRSEYSSRSLLTGAAYTLLITGILIAFLRLLRRLRSISVARLQTLNVRSIRIQSVQLVSSEQIRKSLLHAARGIHWFLVLAALYVCVPLVLSFFPWTREYAPELVEYVVGPLRSAGQVIVDYLPSLFVVVLTCAGAYVLIRISHFLFRELANGTISWPGFYREWADPTHKIVRFLILAMTLVIVFPYLPGSNSPAFRGISIFLGVLFSLGSTSAVANIIAGVILTYTRAFDVGDRVKIADTIGDVTEKTLLATRVRTIKNEFVTVPNSLVLSSHIVNFSSPEGGAPLILHTSVSIGYDAPWRTVHDLLISSALRTSAILREPAPFVLQTSLDDSYVTYEINAYTHEASRMADIYAELHQNIQDCFNEGGVEIMSPHYASLRDGNSTTIPKQHLPKDYSASSFRFEQRRDHSGSSESK